MPLPIPLKNGKFDFQGEYPPPPLLHTDSSTLPYNIDIYIDHYHFESVAWRGGNVYRLVEVLIKAKQSLLI